MRIPLRIMDNAVNFCQQSLVSSALDKGYKVLTVQAKISVMQQGINKALDLVRALLYPVLYCRPVLRPVCSQAKLPVDAIHALNASRDTLKGLAENVFGNHSPYNRFSSDVQIWCGRRISSDAPRVSKMGLIVASPTCHGQRHCQASPSPSHTSDPLLIIKTLGRHVPHHNSK
jgi:hypothetical protein